MKEENKITSEQNKMILEYLKDNYNRARWCVISVIKHNPTQQEWDDYMGVIHEALIKAAKTYNYKKNMAFSSYADMNIRCQIKTNITKMNRKKRKAPDKEVSLNDLVYSDDGLTYQDIYGKYDLEYDDSVDVVKIILNKMSKFERNVTEMLMYGYTVKEICEKLHCSSSKVNAVRECTYKRIDILSLVGQLIK